MGLEPVMYEHPCFIPTALTILLAGQPTWCQRQSAKQSLAIFSAQSAEKTKVSRLRRYQSPIAEASKTEAVAETLLLLMA